MMMQRCSTNTRDAVIMGNLVVYIIRPVCNLIGCDCPTPKPPIFEEQVRFSLLVLARLAMMTLGLGLARAQIPHTHMLISALLHLDRVGDLPHSQHSVLEQKQSRDGHPAHELAARRDGVYRETLPLLLRFI